MADAQGSGPCEGNLVGVQVPPLAPSKNLRGRNTAAWQGWQARSEGGLSTPKQDLRLGIPEVGAITGHRTWQMLAGYTHPKAEDNAAKLAQTV